MENPLSYIDGDLLRQQSLWLLGRLRDAESSQSADAFLISGLVNLLDEIRSCCHDKYGIDCLLIDPDVKDRRDACSICGSCVCIG